MYLGQLQSMIQHYFALRIVKIAEKVFDLETLREPGPTQVGLTIADQSLIDREPIMDCIDIFVKIELIWVARL